MFKKIVETIKKINEINNETKENRIKAELERKKEKLAKYDSSFKKIETNSNKIDQPSDEEQSKEKIKKEFEKNRKKRYKLFLKDIEKKGKEYEKYVGEHFEKLGYIIKFNGIEKGKKDSSIDLIAIKKDEIILIQCKNWKENSRYKINHEKIKAFIGDTYKYIEKNPVFKDYKIKRLFVISNKILDKSAYYYIKENKDLIEFLILPFKKNQ